MIDNCGYIMIHSILFWINMNSFYLPTVSKFDIIGRDMFFFGRHTKQPSFKLKLTQYLNPVIMVSLN